MFGLQIANAGLRFATIGAVFRGQGMARPLLNGVDEPSTEAKSMTYLKLTSNLDASAVAALKPTLELLAAGENNVCFDFSGVNRIDPSGVGALAFLYKRLRSRNRTISVVAAHGQPLALLRNLGLAGMLAAPVTAANGNQSAFLRKLGLAATPTAPLQKAA